jgi:hypothetical protein
MADTVEGVAKVEDGFEWAIVEIFGHRRHVGRAREEERFGSKMLRIDEPTIQADGSIIWASHYYGGSSIFSFTPTDEATVMRYAERRYATPAIPYTAPEDPEFREVEEDDGGDYA